jgi:hypothetical protein
MLRLVTVKEWNKSSSRTGNRDLVFHPRGFGNPMGGRQLPPAKSRGYFSPSAEANDAASEAWQLLPTNHSSHLHFVVSSSTSDIHAQQTSKRCLHHHLSILISSFHYSDTRPSKPCSFIGTLADFQTSIALRDSSIAARVALPS